MKFALGGGVYVTRSLRFFDSDFDGHGDSGVALTVAPINGHLPLFTSMTYMLTNLLGVWPQKECYSTIHTNCFEGHFSSLWGPRHPCFELRVTTTQDFKARVDSLPVCCILTIVTFDGADSTRHYY